MKIYVASSWRNELQSSLVEALRNVGHEVYDFKNPPHGRGGFAWSDIDPDWMNWTADQYKAALMHPVAIDGYQSDMDGMKWADACVLLLPCGRSAHLEAGWFAGAGKPVFVLTRDGEEPELMAKMCTDIATSWSELSVQLAAFELLMLNSTKQVGYADV